MRKTSSYLIINQHVDQGQIRNALNLDLLSGLLWICQQPYTCTHVWNKAHFFQTLILKYFDFMTYFNFKGTLAGLLNNT